jgi:hypothetical protein
MQSYFFKLFPTVYQSLGAGCGISRGAFAPEREVADDATLVSKKGFVDL